MTQREHLWFYYIDYYFELFMRQSIYQITSILTLTILSLD